MRIRDPWPGADPDGQPDEPPPGHPLTEVAYHVPRRYPVLFAGLGIAVGLGGWLTGQRPGWVICGLLGVGLLAYAVRDVVAPVRLRADRQGVTVVHGFASRRRIPWDKIERVRVDERIRLGRETQTLEVDTGDTLYLFTARDLGVDPVDVAEALASLRPGVEGDRGDDGERHEDQ